MKEYKVVNFASISMEVHQKNFVDIKKLILEQFYKKTIYGYDFRLENNIILVNFSINISKSSKFFKKLDKLLKGK